MLRDEQRRHLDAIEAELGRLRAVEPAPVLPDADTVLSRAGGWARVLRAFDVGAQRDVLAELVDAVVPVRLDRGLYEARITWTPLGEMLGRLRDALIQAEAA